MPNISLVNAAEPSRAEAPATPSNPGQRPPFFAQRFIRAMVKTTLANVLSPEAFALKAVIARAKMSAVIPDPEFIARMEKWH